jgi:hypothetical protein
MKVLRLTIIVTVLIGAALLGILAARPAYAQVSPATMPTIDELTPAMLAAAVASVISLVFRFVPGARAWFDTLEGEHKQAFMLAVTFLVGCAIGAYNMAQTGFSLHALMILLATIFGAMSANQVTYQYVKRGKNEAF